MHAGGLRLVDLATALRRVAGEHLEGVRTAEVVADRARVAANSALPVGPLGRLGQGEEPAKPGGAAEAVEDWGRGAGVSGADRWLPGFKFNVEEWDGLGHCVTPAICTGSAFANPVFNAAVAEKPAGRFMMRSRSRVVRRHPEGIGSCPSRGLLAVPE